MKFVSVFIVLGLLTGCATHPPKPATCRGEFRPVNQDRRADLGPKSGERLALCPMTAKGTRHG